MVEIINQIVSKDNIYLGEIQKKENEYERKCSDPDIAKGRK